MIDNGWGGDHVGKLHALQVAMKNLCGAGKIRDRFEKATFPLATKLDRDFPESLRPAFTRIMDARISDPYCTEMPLA